MRKWPRKAAFLLLIRVFAASLFSGVITPDSYQAQFRDHLDKPPSWRFPLGTDALGRDRFARLSYGCRLSLFLSLAAGLVACAIAAAAGAAAGMLGGPWERLFLSATDIFLALPWLFLFFAVRGIIPLNAAPVTSAIATFVLLGLLGWPGPARIVRAAARDLRHADFVLQARASGRPVHRVLLVDVLPNLRPVVAAQFWVSVPVFIAAEATLGLLGLGAAEPLPSWGMLLRELENYDAIAARPWLLAPAIVLVVVLICFHLVLSRKESTA
jgi:ABC-type dipeptide/oligopeptide/nickel transport system permease subunit